MGKIIAIIIGVVGVVLLALFGGRGNFIAAPIWGGLFIGIPIVSFILEKDARKKRVPVSKVFVRPYPKK